MGFDNFLEKVLKLVNLIKTCHHFLLFQGEEAPEIELIESVNIFCNPFFQNNGNIDKYKDDKDKNSILPYRQQRQQYNIFFIGFSRKFTVFGCFDSTINIVQKINKINLFASATIDMIC